MARKKQEAEDRIPVKAHSRGRRAPVPPAPPRSGFGLASAPGEANQAQPDPSDDMDLED